ncbi:MAG: hypothetical protein L0Y72_05380 [Gemmataceae bacterium]|nr:hypothetical protein [Gemmataceae bacterium]
MCIRLVALVCCLLPWMHAVSETASQETAALALGIDGAAFTLNGKRAFLLGLSYYGGLGATDEIQQHDLLEAKRQGMNWIRVWATWAAFDNDVSVVDRDGKPRAENLKKLQSLVARCQQLGLVVDVSLSRGNGVSGPPRLQNLEAHRQAVKAVVTVLKEYRNWYLDLGNERNIKDQRFVSHDELKELRALARQLDPKLLVTASHAGDLTKDDLREYLLKVKLDFLSPHRPRNAQSPAQTEAKSREYSNWMKELGRVVPLHYQEPFRRGFGKWEPQAADFVADLRGARAGGAAGWCFHNGDERHEKDGRPRRSFDMRALNLFEQLDEVERAFLKQLRK